MACFASSDVQLKSVFAVIIAVDEMINTRYSCITSTKGGGSRTFSYDYLLIIQGEANDHKALQDEAVCN